MLMAGRPAEVCPGYTGGLIHDSHTCFNTCVCVCLTDFYEIVCLHRYKQKNPFLSTYCVPRIVVSMFLSLPCLFLAIYPVDVGQMGARGLSAIGQLKKDGTGARFKMKTQTSVAKNHPRRLQ